MSPFFLSALAAAFAAGVPDILAAAALTRSSPARILQVVASGVLGKASYEGGRRSMILGLILQVAMSFVIALIYNLGLPLGAALVSQSPLVCGALSGVAIFIAMNFVVVPLSRAHPKPRWTPASFVAMLIVMILFGEIIALVAAAFGLPLLS
jgi:uncharacterized membrane protein YagU involved in acid resistance